MAGSTGSRILWAGLLAPPLLLLIIASAITIWPERMVGVMDAVQGALTSGPPGAAGPPQGGRSIVRVPPPPPLPPPPMLRGTIRTPDGEPYRGEYMLWIVSRGGFGSFGQGDQGSAGTPATNPHTGPHLAVPIVANLAQIVLDAEGYAPKILGPYHRTSSEAGPARSGGAEATGTGADARDPAPVDVALEPGFTHEVRVVDAQGGPILGAEVSALLMIGRIPVNLGNTLRTDEQGRVVFAALSQAEYIFEVNVHDFNWPDDAISARPEPGGSTTIALDRGPASGVALDEEGRPVVDAVLLIEAEMDARLDIMARRRFQRRIVLARSDAEGRFRLPALHDESTYLIRAEGPDGSLGFAPGVRRRDGEVNVTLRPRRIVRAALNPPGLVPHRSVAIKRSIPTGFDRSDPMGTESQGRGDFWSQIRFNGHPQVDPDGCFEYPAWGSVDTELVVADRSIPVPWPPPEEPLRIDVAPGSPPEERSIRLQFLADPAIRPIRGAMTLHLDNAPPERAHQDVTRAVEIREEAASFRCLSNESFSFDSSAVPGFWTVPGRISGGGGDGERIADVRVFASCSIAGRVLDADGKPAGVGTTIGAPFDPEWARNVLRDRLAPTTGTSSDEISAGQQHREMEARPSAAFGMQGEEATTDAEGRFEIPAFPLGASARMWVRRGNYVLRGDVLRMAPGSTRAEVEFRLPRLVGASIRIVDPQGRPIPGARVAISQVGTEPVRAYAPVGKTDADGRCFIEELAEGDPNYSLCVWFEADFRPIVAPLVPGGPTLELRAERGEVVEGRVVEAVTGWPIPGLTLYARPPGEPVDAEVRTDSDGRFRFSTLRPGPVRLEDRRGLNWLSVDHLNVRAGSGRPVVLRVIDLREFDPQPRPVPKF